MFISKDEGTDPCQPRVAVHFLIFHLIHDEGVTNLPSNLDDHKAIQKRSQPHRLKTCYSDISYDYTSEWIIIFHYVITYNFN